MFLALYFFTLQAVAQPAPALELQFWRLFSNTFVVETKRAFDRKASAYEKELFPNFLSNLESDLKTIEDFECRTDALRFDKRYGTYLLGKVVRRLGVSEICEAGKMEKLEFEVELDRKRGIFQTLIETQLELKRRILPLWLKVKNHEPISKDDLMEFNAFVEDYSIQNNILILKHNWNIYLAQSGKIGQPRGGKSFEDSGSFAPWARNAWQNLGAKKRAIHAILLDIDALQ